MSKPQGNLWTGLALAEARELIKFSAEQLKRVYALREQEKELPAWRRNPGLVAEAKAWEQAHDQHWTWAREIEAREAWAPRKSVVG